MGERAAGPTDEDAAATSDRALVVRASQRLLASLGANDLAGAEQLCREIAKQDPRDPAFGGRVEGLLEQGSKADGSRVSWSRGDALRLLYLVAIALALVWLVRRPPAREPPASLEVTRSR